MTANGQMFGWSNHGQRVFGVGVLRKIGCSHKSIFPRQIGTTRIENDRFDMLLRAGKAETNQAKRRDIYVEMQQIVHEDGGLALPVFQSDIMGYRTSMHVPDQIANNWELDGHHACRRWWQV